VTENEATRRRARLDFGILPTGYESEAWNRSDQKREDMARKDTRGACAVAQFLLVAMTVIGGAKADAIGVVDQQNAGPFNGSQGGVVFGQSFTPMLSRIDVFEVEIGDFGAIAQVQILAGVAGFDGLGGRRAWDVGTCGPECQHPATFSIHISRRHRSHPGRQLRSGNHRH
jgi:hypothetical protein